MSEPRADVLAKILLVQNVIGQLPEESSIFGFLCRALRDTPGVLDASFDPSGREKNPEKSAAQGVEHLTLALGEKKYGELSIQIGEAAAYQPYAPFIQNLCFMVSVILEERRQRAINTAYQRDLESRVEERTLQLREEMKRAERYLAVSKAMIVELDTRGFVNLINTRGCDILGRQPQELLGKDWFEIALPPAQREPARRDFLDVIEGRRALRYHHDSEIVTRDGVIRMIVWRNECRVSETGTILGMLSSGVDITERKQAENALSDEKERLAVTLRSIGDGVITTDIHGKVMMMNRVAEHLTGWRTEEASGRPLAEVFRIINEQTRSPCENPCDKVLGSGLIVELANHTVLIARDGTERPIADSGAPIKDRQSVTIGVVLVFRDMTEKYKLLANAQRNDRLDALAILAGGIAHDFNNLLGGLFGYIDHAQRISTENLVLLNLEKALSVFGRAKDLTQQLLTFAKGGTPVKQTADIRPLLKDSVAFALSGTNIGCHYDIAEDLWTCDFDRNQLAQVIDNIVINAHQAMPNGGSIGISAGNFVAKGNASGRLSAGEYLKISISDTGTGIPSDKIDRIFDPFFTTKKTGSGLGLATCYSIIQKHDGIIEVTSVVGEGTTFDIYLPASRQTAYSEDRKPKKRHRGQGRILIMDDEVYLRDVMSMALKLMGYEVVAVEEGAAAVAQWAEAEKKLQPFKAGFLDLTIRGGMGGCDAIIELRRIGATVPIIATSGYSGDPIMARPADFGFTASIHKPFTVEELSDLLNRLFP